MKTLTKFFLFCLLIFCNSNTFSQIRLTKVDVPNNRVIIKNFGASTVNISGYWFCHSFAYHQVSDGTIVNGSSNLVAGAQVELALSQALNNSGSDLSFYSSPSFGSSAAMVDFTQWGSGGNGRENVAVAKGIWTAGQFVNTTSTAIYYGGTGSENGLSNWSTTPHPNVTSIVRLTPTDATTDADQVVFRVTFDRGVQNVDVTDFSISGTAAGDGTVNNVSAVSQSIYDVTITGVTNSAGTINLDIKGNGSTVGVNDIIADPLILDQNQTSSPNTINRSEFGQSFTANNTGELSSVSLFVAEGGISTYTGTATMELRSGDGLSGAILATETINITGGTGFQNFAFSTPANVTTGQQYTIRFTGPGNFSSEFVVRASTGDPLPGGVIYQPTVLASADLTFKVFVHNGGGQGGLSPTAPSTDETYTIQNNTAPTATNVNITGSFQAGQQLTGTYTWTDTDNGDTESGTTFKWYRSDDATGTGKTEIAGSNTINYTLTNTDINKYISFEVTPNDGTTAGTPVESTRTLVANVFITSIARQTPSNATTKADEVTFRVIFSAGVARVSKEDFVLSGTVAGDGTVSSITRINGSTYDVKVTGITISEGTINLDLKGVDAAGTNNIIKANEVRDATNNGNLVQDSGGDTFFWQSFTAEQTGLFHSVTLRKSQHSHTYEGTATLKLYAGEGTGGAELASQQIFTSQSSGDETYYFELPAGITQGTQYTWFWQAGNGTGATGFSGQTGNLYGGGRGLSEQFPGATSLDWYFITETITGAIEDLGSTAPSTDETYTIVNPPMANNVAIAGTAEIGEQLTGSYNYSDPQSDAESGTTFRWLRADDANGTGKTAIANATTTSYTVQVADAGKFLIFEVTASDGIVVGDPTESVAKQVQLPLSIQSIVRHTPTTANITAATDPIFRVIFSEDVKNVTIDDFILNSTAGGAISSFNSVDGKTFDLTINNLNNVDGTLGLKVKGIDGASGTNDINTFTFENGVATHQQTTENDYLNQARIGQSFTAASNNYLTAFTLFAKTGNHTFSGTARLRIFQGDASNSTILNDPTAVLTTETVNISNNTASSGQTFDITSPPQLTSGMMYSIVLDLFTGSGDRAFLAHTSGSLAGGSAFFTGSHSGHSGFDFMIDIFENAKVVKNLFDQAPATNEVYTVEADTTSPTVLDVTAVNDNGTYVTGDVIAISVNFSETVVVSGTPTLTLETGTTDRVATYSSSDSSASTVIFNYTVQAGDVSSDLEVLSANAISLGGAGKDATTIQDAAGNNAVLTLPIGATTSGALSNNKDIIIDGLSPVLVSSVPVDDSANIATDGNIVLTFDRDIALGTGNIQIVDLNDGSSTKTIDVANANGQVSVNGKVLTIDPLGALSTNKPYAVQIAVTAVEDTNGNAYSGISDTTTLNFSTSVFGGPIGAPSNLVFGTKTATTINVASFTAAPGSGTLEYVIKMNTTNDFTDLQPTAGSVGFGSPNLAYGGGEQLIYDGTSTSPNITVTGLSANTMYYFKVYAYLDNGGADFPENDGTTASTSTTQVATLTFDNITKTYGDASFKLAATSNSSGTISYEIVGEANGTSLSGTNNEDVSLGNVGSVIIRAALAADGNYEAQTKDITLTINKAVLTVTAEDKTKVYGDDNPVFTVSYVGFKNSETATVLTTVPSATSTATSASAVGSYDINVSGGGQVIIVLLILKEH